MHGKVSTARQLTACATPCLPRDERVREVARRMQLQAHIVCAVPHILMHAARRRIGEWHVRVCSCTNSGRRRGAWEGRRAQLATNDDEDGLGRYPDATSQPASQTRPAFSRHTHTHTLSFLLPQSFGRPERKESNDDDDDDKIAATLTSTACVGVVSVHTIPSSYIYPPLPTPALLSLSSLSSHRHIPSHLAHSHNNITSHCATPLIDDYNTRQ